MKLLQIIIFLLLSSVSLAQSSADFNKLLNAVQTMTADFKQTIYDNHNKPVQSSYGHMVFARPDKFRWQVTKPIPQLIIANGQRLWIYDPDLQQVIIRPIKKAVGNTPALLLSHNSNTVDKDFNVQELPQSQSNKRQFSLTPKQKDNMFANITMHFTGNQISEMYLEDQLGHRTKIQFTQAVINKNVGPNTFNFKLPANADVIDETQKRQ